MCTRFGVDSSSRFPFRAQTNKQTDATERPTHAGGYTAGMGNYISLPICDPNFSLKHWNSLLWNFPDWEHPALYFTFTVRVGRTYLWAFWRQLLSTPLTIWCCKPRLSARYQTHPPRPRLAASVYNDSNRNKPALTRVQKTTPGKIQRGLHTQPASILCLSENRRRRGDLDLWHFDPKINRFPALIVGHYYVQFGHPGWIGFWDIVWKNRQTNKQRW